MLGQTVNRVVYSKLYNMRTFSPYSYKVALCHEWVVECRDGNQVLLYIDSFCVCVMCVVGILYWLRGPEHWPHMWIAWVQHAIGVVRQYNIRRGACIKVDQHQVGCDFSVSVHEIYLRWKYVFFFLAQNSSFSIGLGTWELTRRNRLQISAHTINAF